MSNLPSTLDTMKCWCPAGKMRGLHFFFHSSHWVVLSKRKGRRQRCGVLLAGLRASEAAPPTPPLMSWLQMIRLEGGSRGRWSHSATVLYMLCMYVCVWHLRVFPTGSSGFPGRWVRKRFDESFKKHWKSGVTSPRSPSPRSTVGRPTSVSTSQGGSTEM